MNKKISLWLEENITLHSHDSPREELVNSATHALGAFLSLAATLFMLVKVAERPRLIPGILVYGGAMILLYSASSLYHRVAPGNQKRIFRILDHSNIYLLIAGTYTPICFVMNSSAGWTLLTIVWSLAALGILFTLFFWGRLKLLHVLFYLIMGWLIVFFWSDLKRTVPGEMIFFMLGGGITYSLGTLVYASKKMPYYHGIWHLFVLGGSIFFFIGIYFYLI